MENKNENGLAADLSQWIRKWAGLAGMLLLCVITVSAIAIGLNYAAERLNTVGAYDVGADVLGIAVCALLYYGCFSNKQGKDESTPLFMALLLCDGVLLFCDVMTWMVDGNPQLRAQTMTLNTLYVCGANVMCYQLWRYIRVYLPMDNAYARRCDLAMRITLSLLMLICLSNLIVPILFYVNEQGFLVKTEMYSVCSGHLAALLVIGTLYLLKAKAPAQNKIIISMFYIIPIAQSALFLFVDTRWVSLPDTPLLVIIMMYVVLVGERTKAMISTSAELNMATRIQANGLPNRFPAFPNHSEFDVYATMDPARQVGGDFYDFFLIDEDRLALVVADVSGKGVPAALFMMTARTIIKTKAQSNPALSPKELLEEANAALTENNAEDMFVTVWFGVLRISTGELTYSDAGHEKLLLYQDGAWQYLPKNGGVALAMWDPEDLECLDEQHRFRNMTIHLNPGDAIFQYSDGVTEAANAENQLFGEDRLLTAMNSAPSTKPEELLPYVRGKIDAFVKEAPQFDDITMLGLRYQGR